MKNAFGSINLKWIKIDISNSLTRDRKLNHHQFVTGNKYFGQILRATMMISIKWLFKSGSGYLPYCYQYKYFEHFPFSIWYFNNNVVDPCHWFIIFLFYSLIVFGIDLYELKKSIHIVGYVSRTVKVCHTIKNLRRIGIYFRNNFEIIERAMKYFLLGSFEICQTFIIHTRSDRSMT